MSAGQKCDWCDGSGTKLDRTCGWCDGTGIQKPSFPGGGGASEHRTCGPIRAWCYDCNEWCYASGEDMFCRCCIEAGGVKEVRTIRRWELFVYLILATTIGFWLGRVVEAYARG